MACAWLPGMAQPFLPTTNRDTLSSGTDGFNQHQQQHWRHHVERFGQRRMISSGNERNVPNEKNDVSRNGL